MSNILKHIGDKIGIFVEINDHTLAMEIPVVAKICVEVGLNEGLT
jgi:hypothetical protein